MTATLVIMAAGLGQRFGGPKQLAPVGPSGEALLDYTLFDARRAGFRRAFIVVRPELQEAMARHLERFRAAYLPVTFVHQRIEDLPAGWSRPTGRSKPWGTAHAVLAARAALGNLAFAVCNADDWYGPGSLWAARQHLRSPIASVPDHAIVSYRLDDTLSAAGGVARGVVRATADGWLEKIDEVRDLQASHGGITGHLGGRIVHYGGEEPVSMNLWAFRPAVMAALARQFNAFLADHIEDPDAEFPLSNAIGEQVTEGAAAVRVLTTEECWMGMTYVPDVDNVKQVIAEYVSRGDYPPDLCPS